MTQELQKKVDFAIKLLQAAEKKAAEVGRVLGRNHSSVVYFNKKTRDWLHKPFLNKRGACAIKELEKRYG